jgi:hypothetical protein
MSLNVIQQKLKVPKGQFNNFGKYKYRSCEDIVEAIKPLLGKSVLTLSDDIVVETNGWVYVKATATLVDEKGVVYTTSAFAREPEMKKGMDSSQITGTASSYARKYALNGLFCIDDTKDADTDEHTQQVNKPVPKSVSRPAQKKSTPSEWPASFTPIKELKAVLVSIANKVDKTSYLDICADAGLPNDLKKVPEMNETQINMSLKILKNIETTKL